MWWKHIVNADEKQLVGSRHMPLLITEGGLSKVDYTAVVVKRD